MRPTSEDLIRTIAFTLERKVLTELPGATWTASYVRSCLMLLAHLEARIGVESAVLAEDNAELEGLLAKADAREAPEDAETGQVAAAPDLEALRSRNEQLQSELNTLIEQAYVGDTPRRGQIQQDLARYRSHAVERDARLFGRALSMSPL